MVTSRFKNNPSLLFPLAVLVVLVAVVFVYIRMGRTAATVAPASRIQCISGSERHE